MSQGYFSPSSQAPILQMTHFLHLLPITLQLVQTNCDKVPLENTWQRQLPKQKRGARGVEGAHPPCGQSIPAEHPAAPRTGEVSQGARGSRASRSQPALCCAVPVPRACRGQEQRRARQRRHNRQPHRSQRSWSSSQWDTAGKDKRKGSKNKVKPAQCPIPLKTSSFGKQTFAEMGAEEEAGRGAGEPTMQLKLRLHNPKHAGRTDCRWQSSGKDGISSEQDTWILRRAG